MKEKSFTAQAIERNEKGQSMRNAAAHRTICEVLREINDMHQGTSQLDITTRSKAYEAMQMAKRMDRKLKEYNKEYDAGWWEANKDYEADLERRLATDYITLDNEAVPEPVRVIPSMGGREIGRHLRKWASECPDETSIIELGVWLGAGTAQLALGVKESGRDVIVHGYDRFRASSSEVKKAEQQGIELVPGQNTEPVVVHLLRSAGLLHYVGFSIGEISKAKRYEDDDGPISMYVDDANKQPGNFIGALRNFGPYWMGRITIVVLMDYWYFEQKPTKTHLHFQHDWMQRNQFSFEPIMLRMPGTSAAAFRYLGGKPWEE